MSKDRENGQSVELHPEEEWIKLVSRKVPAGVPIIAQLPEASGRAHRYEETPVRFSGTGLIKGLTIERIGQDSGQASRQALVWTVEIIDATIDAVG